MSRLTKEEQDLVKKAREIVDRDANAPASKAQPLPATAKEPGGECKFRHARDFLTSVMKACQRPGQNFDERLIPYYSENVEAIREGGPVRKAVGSDEARAISDPYGGFLVPTTFTPELLKLDPEADPIAGKTRQIPMASPIVKIPARTDKNHTTSVSGGLTVTRRPETVAATSSQMQVENVTLEAHSLFGLSYASEELLRDSPISFTAILAAGFSDQFAYHLIKERLYGTGVGEFLGVLTALDASNLGPTVSVAKETGQAADTIVYENILKMRARCWGYANAVWLANHDTMPELMRLNQAVGTGGAVVWQPSAREDHPDMLLGRPLYFSEYAKTLGDQGDIGLYNWGEYLEGTYQPMANEESVHVRFVNHERAYKFWTRNSGQPWWRTALTPAYSQAKLSPFVVLDAR
jgi:HK97 family phage major capsid protein